MIDADGLSRLIEPGSTVAIADGVGCPVSAIPALVEVARATPDVRLFLGWMPAPIELPPAAFADIATVMAGYGLRDAVDRGTVRYIPRRLGTVAALLSDVVRPKVLLASVVRWSDGGLRFATEVSWFRAALRAGAVIAAVERPGLASADAGPPLPPERTVLIGVDDSPSLPAPFGAPTDVHRAIGERVAPLIPEGVRLQYAPGGLGTAVVEALVRPVELDTGILTDVSVDLADRGLLVDTPTAPYLAGDRVEKWAAGRPILHPVEHTHDPGRLAQGRPLVAVNTALEIDGQGQVNVESVRGSAVAGVGGQPDFAAAAARALGGLSIIALPSEVNGRPTLVDSLSAPVSTPAHDVEIVVTEHGAADLRGLDRRQRQHALESLWAC